MSHISVGLREILQTILIHVVKDAKPLEYFHTLFHHHALPSVTTPLYHDSDFGDSKLIWSSDRWLLITKLVNSDHSIKSEKKILSILYQKGLRKILQTIVIHVVKDAKPLEYFHTLFHHIMSPEGGKLLPSGCLEKMWDLWLWQQVMVKPMPSN